MTMRTENTLDAASCSSVFLFLLVRGRDWDEDWTLGEVVVGSLASFLESGAAKEVSSDQRPEPQGAERRAKGRC